MKRINLRLWLNTSQRRTLEMACYLVLLSAGCVAGTIFTLTDTVNSLSRFCLAYGLPQTDGSILLASVRWCAGLLTMSFFLGFCGIGQPLLITLLVFHGFSTGCVLTDFSEHAASAAPVMYIAAAVYSAAASFTLLLGIRESFRLSCTSIKACLIECDSSEMRRRFRMYCIRYMVLMVLIIAESAGFAGLCKIL